MTFILSDNQIYGTHECLDNIIILVLAVPVQFLQIVRCEMGQIRGWGNESSAKRKAESKTVCQDQHSHL